MFTIVTVTIIGTNWYYSMRSNTKYSGVNAHGGSFVAFAKLYLDSQNFLVFHPVLHTLWLDMNECANELKPFWIKRLQMLYKYVACSAQRGEHLKHISQN